MSISFKVNNEQRTLDVDPDTPLLWVLRDDLRLTGTKFGCGIAQCGACTVHVNGQPRRACVTPVSTLDGASVTTIEGLEGPQADAVREAWAEYDTPQCGYCQSGQIMTAAALLSRNPKPSDEDIDKALAGNICKCATYVRIRKAVKSAGEKLGG
ncbi:(2Fe-2S)-binding protein [Hyphococcus luteus]|uniref:Isoquinoline 1-oxidoreductase n=1 Tax=Hyphococcus luteus TaxID=2058213 RepID=A0A2S7K0K3_9PROT|nr:(2Fe-2S)-binding protein [Marinicaulis flavus]PQA86053.1 isoquinoline 1-oxidoreductase [Marinicaulis flavus]